jgi:hypothetical protein
MLVAKAEVIHQRAPLLIGSRLGRHNQNGHESEQMKEERDQGPAYEAPALAVCEPAHENAKADQKREKNGDGC